MWIITKKSIINSQLCSMFYEDESGTNAVCNTEDCLISKNKILSKILDALKSDIPFLEVD